MPVHRASLLATVAAVAMTGCSPEPKLFADVPAERSAQVTVLEPDALVVDGRQVRLSNATTPQLAPHAHCWAEALAAYQARQAVQTRFAEARDVSVTPTGGLDEYNRALARVQVDGIDLGQTLLDGGLAATPGDVRFDWCAPLSADLARGPRIPALTGSER